MSEEKIVEEEAQYEEVAEVSMEERIEEISAAYEEVGFFKRLAKISKGIKMPKSSREYKEARTEIQRLIAPFLAIVCPLLFVVVTCVMTEITGRAKTKIEVEIARAQEDNEALEEEVQTEVEQQTEETEVEITVDTPNDMPSEVTDVVTPSLADTPTENIQRADPNSVSLVKSPVQMKSVFGETRSASSRMAAMRRYGGDPRTEAAVVNALRWLKTQQKHDGSWYGTTGADGQGLTGLVILTFLAHGEKSGAGTEFGECVMKGLEWLMNRKERLDPVGTHALAEAYGFLKNPNLKENATEAVRVMADRLANTTWGPVDDKGINTRPMLLRMAFQTMALRSAKLSGIEPKGINLALAKLKEGFLIQGNKKIGGFSSDYYGPPRADYRRTGIWHSMVGVVGLQYLGFGNLPIVEKTMRILDDDWEMPTLGSIDSSCCPVRGNYWAAMVFFNGGGKRWQNFNRHMIDAYYKGQTVLKGAYTDIRGNICDMGYWKSEDMHIGSQPISTTCWVAQQLMVYYRYLPTSSKTAWTSPAKEEDKSDAPVGDEVEVEVDI
jgi:hypothetical protein